MAYQFGMSLDKISYLDYVRNQAQKEAGVYAVRSALVRSKFFKDLDPGWKAAIIAHYGVFAMPEYLATFGVAHMDRFGRAAAWRNMALLGTLDEVRHGQLQPSFPDALLNKDYTPLAHRRLSFSVRGIGTSSSKSWTGCTMPTTSASGIGDRPFSETRVRASVLRSATGWKQSTRGGRVGLALIGTPSPRMFVRGTAADRTHKQEAWT
jgi:methane/phenol/toluene hydroxylase